MSDSTIHAFTDDALGDHDAVALAAHIRSGDLSAREVAAAAIERAAVVEPHINAIVVDRYEHALARADHSVGPFAGVPMFVKDQDDVAGLPTRFGSDAFANAGPATKTSAVIDQMFDMGMVCLGKSSLPEFGFVPSTEFPENDPTRNPWNLGHTVGGSSGGAAALVATGVVPVAHAADGGGSIRIPASCAGLVGLKPSRGRLIRSADAPKMPVDVVADGVVTRSVRDTALYLAEAEARHRNPKLPPIGLVEHPVDRPLRIGATLDSPAGGVVDAPSQQVFEQTISLLESLGHHVESVDLPVTEQFGADFELYWSSFAATVQLVGRQMIHSSFERERLTELTKGLASSFRRNMHRTPSAIYRLHQSAAAHEAVFRDLDLVMTPTIGQIPPPLGHLGLDLAYDTLFPRVKDWVLFTPYANATGAPSISLPLGFDEASNLPIGMMFDSALGNERLLLELAFQLEEAQPPRRLGA